MFLGSRKLNRVARAVTFGPGPLRGHSQDGHPRHEGETARRVRWEGGRAPVYHGRRSPRVDRMPCIMHGL